MDASSENVVKTQIVPIQTTIKPYIRPAGPPLRSRYQSFVTIGSTKVSTDFCSPARKSLDAD